MKLTKAQREVLGRLSDVRGMSSYELSASLSTLRALCRKGLADLTNLNGYIFYPRNNIKFKLTAAGRAALKGDK